jgi:hypothetical protein
MSIFPVSTGCASNTGLGSNTLSEIRVVNFCNQRLHGEVILMIVRGIDGGSVLPVAWGTLIAQWPWLSFHIVFVVPDRWFRMRCYRSPAWESARRPDGKMYGGFDVRTILANCCVLSNDGEYKLTLREWNLGNQYRKGIRYVSSCYGQPSLKFTAAMRLFTTLSTGSRNVMPH